jgi:hypothetical protein
MIPTYTQQLRAHHATPEARPGLFVFFFFFFFFFPLHERIFLGFSHTALFRCFPAHLLRFTHVDVCVICMVMCLSPPSVPKIPPLAIRIDFLFAEPGSGQNRAPIVSFTSRAPNIFLFSFETKLGLDFPKKGGISSMYISSEYISHPCNHAMTPLHNPRFYFNFFIFFFYEKMLSVKRRRDGEGHGARKNARTGPTVYGCVMHAVTVG